MKLEITGKDGKSHLVGQRNFSAYDRQFLSLTIGEHWGWYGVYLFNNISWPDTKKADVYLRVLAYKNDDDEAYGRNPKIIFKSAVLKGVSPSENKTLTIMPQNGASMPFPFDISHKHNYVHQLMAIDGSGKEYIWIATRAYGLATGPYQESVYENGSIQNGEIHFGADADVSIYFTLNTN